MGCWNQTCAVSNLPIMVGDEVVLLPLISSGNTENVGTTYYDTDCFAPLSMPIYGEYNDYGGVESVRTNVVNEELLKHLKFFTENGNYKITEEDISKAYKRSVFKSLKYITSEICDLLPKTQMEWDGVEEFANTITYEPCFVEYRSKLSGDFEYRIISYMMIHRDLYDAMVKNVSQRIPYDKDKCYRDLYRERIKKYIEKCRMKKRMRKEAIENAETKEQKDMAEVYDMMDNYPFNNHASNLRICDNITPAIGYNFLIEKLIEEDNNELMEEILDSIMFKEALSIARKGYLVNTGLGSQSREYQMHKVIADFTELHISNVLKELREDDMESSPEELLSETFFWWDDK